MQRAARIVAAVPVSADSWLASSFSSGHCRCYCHKGVNQISRWFSQQPIMTLLLDNWQKITAKIRTCLERSLTDRIFANQTTFFGEGLYTNIRILNGHFQIQNNVFIIQRFLSRHLSEFYVPRYVAGTLTAHTGLYSTPGVGAGRGLPPGLEPPLLMAAS